MGMSRKETTFDLSQEALRKHYPRKETAQGIRRFMDANGFDRRQYSVYVSRSELTALDVAVLTQRMAEQLPWLRLCVKEITATNIGARHNYGVPAATQRSGCGGERRKEWSGWSPRHKARMEQSGISSNEGCCALCRPLNSSRSLRQRDSGTREWYRSDGWEMCSCGRISQLFITWRR